MTDLSRVRQAIKFLLKREDYQDLKKSVWQLARIDHGGFQDELFVLDPLVDLAREKPVDRIDELFKLCDDYYARNNPEYRKTVYQRNYMAERRRRLNKAIKLKQRMEDRLLSPEEKDVLRSEMQAWWMVMQEQWLEERGTNRAPEMLQQFWDELEADLDAGLKGDTEAARKVLGM